MQHSANALINTFHAQHWSKLTADSRTNEWSTGGAACPAHDKASSSLVTCVFIQDPDQVTHTHGWHHLVQRHLQDSTRDVTLQPLVTQTHTFSKHVHSVPVELGARVWTSRHPG